jgi:hypothetical protein
MIGETMPEYLTTEQVSTMTTLSKPTLERQRCTGEGIRYIKMGSGRTSRVVYDKRDVVAYMESKKRGSTSEEDDQ